MSIRNNNNHNGKGLGVTVNNERVRESLHNFMLQINIETREE